MRSRPFHFCVLSLIVLWGGYLRAAALSDRPFWRDEVWVAELAEQESYGALMKGPDLPVPPLFAVTVKLLGQWVGPSELGLRLFPLLCGIACLPLGYIVLRVLRVPRWPSLAGVAMCAGSPMLVLWSRELKQYEVEACLSLLLAWCVFHARRFGCTAAHVVAIACVSVLGPWLGYGMVFAIGTCVLLLALPGRGGWSSALIRTAILCAIGGTASTFVLMNSIAGRQAATPSLQNFVGHWFIHPLDPADWVRAGAYAAKSSAMMVFPLSWSGDLTAKTGFAPLAGCAAVVWGAALLGFLLAWRGVEKRAVLLWTLFPWVGMLIAAVLHRYPFAMPRMMVFVAPAMCLAAGVGLVRFGRILANVLGRSSSMGIAMGMVLSCLPLLLMSPPEQRVGGWVHHDFPTLLNILAHERRADEWVVTTVEAVPSVRYYAPSGMRVAFMPMEPGTLPLLDFDYAGHVRDLFATVGDRGWILTVSRQASVDRQLLIDEALSRGYEVAVYAEAGTEGAMGMAQLISVTR